MKINQSTRTKLQSYETIEERLNFLKGMFKGDTAYLISCGPTLTQHDKEILNKDYYFEPNQIIPLLR